MMISRSLSNLLRMPSSVARKCCHRNLSSRRSTLRLFDQQSSRRSASLAAAAAALSFAAAVASLKHAFGSTNVACHGDSDRGCDHEKPPSVDGFLKSKSSSEIDLNKLPVYTSAQVQEHNGDRIWMSLGGFVYDVTDFIPHHPGGTQRIQRAAGAALEPFWILHQQHYATEQPMEILQPLLIGRLASVDQERVEQQVEELQKLQDQFWLSISMSISMHNDTGELNRTTNISLKKLQSLPKTDAVGQVGCPQNEERRPVSTNLFGGVRMGDLLQYLGVNDVEKFGKFQFIFHAMDGETVTVEDIGNLQDILICYEMNGAPLTQQRGYPLRIMVPGKRVIKWVKSIEINAVEAEPEK